MIASVKNCVINITFLASSFTWNHLNYKFNIKSQEVSQPLKFILIIIINYQNSNKFTISRRSGFLYPVR